MEIWLTAVGKKFDLTVDDKVFVNLSQSSADEKMRYLGVSDAEIAHAFCSAEEFTTYRLDV